MVSIVCSSYRLSLFANPVTYVPGIYRNYGWEGLAAEMEMDVKRIFHRNLGRDDRSFCTYVTPCFTTMITDAPVNLLYGVLLIN